MKVRFYCDLPPYLTGLPTQQLFLTANTQCTWAKADGFKRIAFDVDIPPQYLTGQVDAVAPVVVVGEIE
jgi:hypothetical protein